VRWPDRAAGDPQSGPGGSWVSLSSVGAHTAVPASQDGLGTGLSFCTQLLSLLDRPATISDCLLTHLVANVTGFSLLGADRLQALFIVTMIGWRSADVDSDWFAECQPRL